MLKLLGLFLIAAGVGVAGVVLTGGAPVAHRERAAGVQAQLNGFLDWWEKHGLFAILVAPDGGLRAGPEAEANQAKYYAQGNSHAKTLQETPHGRGGALDLWPADFDPTKPVSWLVYSKFLAIGIAAEAYGLVWGGRWSSFGKSAVNPYGGDLPHVEVKNWLALQFPPNTSAPVVA